MKDKLYNFISSLFNWTSYSLIEEELKKGAEDNGKVTEENA